MQRHHWLPAIIHRPPVMGPNALRYIDYFLGLLADSPLGTGAKMELIALINGFALMYGGMQAALAAERARTGVTAEEQAAAPIALIVAAAASGHYPNLAAALAAPGPAARRRGRRLRLLRHAPHRRRAGRLNSARFSRAGRALAPAASRLRRLNG